MNIHTVASNWHFDFQSAISGLLFRSLRVIMYYIKVLCSVTGQIEDGLEKACFFRYLKAAVPIETLFFFPKIQS